MKVTDFVYEKSTVIFDSYRAGFFYYIVPHKEDGEYYIFPIPVEDIGNGTMERTDKAITYMRWIRKGIEDKTLIKYEKLL